MFSNVSVATHQYYDLVSQPGQCLSSVSAGTLTLGVSTRNKRSRSPAYLTTRQFTLTLQRWRGAMPLTASRMGRYTVVLLHRPHRSLDNPDYTGPWIHSVPDQALLDDDTATVEIDRIRNLEASEARIFSPKGLT